MQLDIETRAWPLKEPFEISRGVQTTAEVLIVRLSDGGFVGCGEAAGVPYRGDDLSQMVRQARALRAQLTPALSRQTLLRALPPGGARNAIDAALWDLEAKRCDIPAWKRAGVPKGGALSTAVTIGIRPLSAYAGAARAVADFEWIKVKVDAGEPLAAVSSVRAAAPRARLIVDTNQSWSFEQLRAWAPGLRDLGVELLEQPLPAGRDEVLLDYDCPVSICADESVESVDDLPWLVGRYDYVNIKLDKTGGLTAALDLARAADDAGLRLMVGCMVGGSIAMAPAMVLGQICEVCDLDGPLLQSEDWPGGIVYERGRMHPPWPGLWG